MQERDRRHGRLRQALDEARRELVDPSRRNRLLHAPLTGKRPWCMAIVGHDADELFDMLHRQENFRGYAFQGCDEEEADQEGDRGVLLTTTQPSLRPDLYDQLPQMIGGQTKDSPVPPAGQPRLQNPLAHDRLAKKLTKVYHEESTLEDKQGITAPYLAVAFF